MRFVLFLCGRRRGRPVPVRHNDDNRSETDVRIFLQAETSAGQPVFLRGDRAGVLPMGGYWDGFAGENKKENVYFFNVIFNPHHSTTVSDSRMMCVCVFFFAGGV